MAVPNEKTSFGYVVTSSTGYAAVRATPYNEQTSNAQRSIVSTDTNDDMGGTGARKVLITYFDEDLAGPLEEEVELNGTTPVDLVATDMCFIQEMKVTEVGSQLGNVGSIFLRATTGGGGANVGSIAPGDNKTNWAHHYIPAGGQAYLREVLGHVVSFDSGELSVRRSTPTVPNTPEQPVYPELLLEPGKQLLHILPAPVEFSGPCLLALWAKATTSESAAWFAGIGFQET